MAGEVLLALPQGGLCLRCAAIFKSMTISKLPVGGEGWQLAERYMRV